MIPAQWPAALAPELLDVIDMSTPYLVTDLDTVARRHDGLVAALPGVSTFYAMKCNPSPEILRTLAARGSSFEVASIGELRMLQAIGVDPAGVLYSNPVKPPAHIEAAYEAGLWRFSFDSPNELAKIATHAPGAAVYVRLRVDDTTSVFPLSRKFGTDVEDAYDLMLLARRLGLRPYGVTFHVGSQCGSTTAWRTAVADAGTLMEKLLADDIKLEMLDLGGGFPARYVDGVPTVEEIGAVVTAAVADLPYRPALLAAEPGRHLVAEAGVMAMTVIGREERGDENWLFVEVGAYNGLMESIQTPGGWDFPLWTSLPDHASAAHQLWTVTGPSCDSSDTIAYGVSLPATLTVGDVLYVGSTGAYTLAYASAFNGFQPPTPVFVGTGNPPTPTPALSAPALAALVSEAEAEWPEVVWSGPRFSIERTGADGTGGPRVSVERVPADAQIPVQPQIPSQPVVPAEPLAPVVDEPRVFIERPRVSILHPRVPASRRRVPVSRPVAVRPVADEPRVFVERPTGERAFVEPRVRVERPAGERAFVEPRVRVERPAGERVLAGWPSAQRAVTAPRKPVAVKPLSTDSIAADSIAAEPADPLIPAGAGESRAEL